MLLFSIAVSESIQSIGFMAGIAALAAVALLAVTLSLAMFVYIRCRRQQSGLWHCNVRSLLLLLWLDQQVPAVLQVMQNCKQMMTWRWT